MKTAICRIALSSLFFVISLSILPFGFVTSASAQVPSLPTNLYPNDGSQLAATIQVTLSWAAVPGATHYNVRANNWTNSTQRDPRNNCPGSPHYLCVDVLTTASITLPVNPGSSYGFFLQACNASGCGAVASANFVVNQAPTIPGLPTSLTPQDGFQIAATAQVTLSWSAVDGATYYNVRANNYTNSTIRDPRNTCTPHYLCIDGVTSVTIALPVNAGSGYGFFLQACNAAGCGAVAFSNFTVAAPPTIPAAPVGLSPVSGTFSETTTNVTLSWNPVPGATSYAVRANDNTDPNARVPNYFCVGAPHYLCTNTIPNSFSVPVLPGHNYSWWVHACNSAGCSNPAFGNFIVSAVPTFAVYNRSSYSTATANRLAIAAHTSTGIGLIQAADHVVVTDNYVAWLSYADAAYARSGALTGLWTVDPLTQNLKYGRNQLIPGSEGGGNYFWDNAGPPVEHVLEIVPNTNEPNKTLLIAHNYIQNYGNGTFTRVATGMTNADNTISFITAGRMGGFARDLSTLVPQGYVTSQDVRFGNRYVYSKVEYRFASNYIDSIWTLDVQSAAQSVPSSFSTNNAFMFAWTGYAPGYKGNANANCAPLTNDNVPTVIFNSGQYIRRVIGNVDLGTAALTAGNYCAIPKVNYDINSFSIVANDYIEIITALNSTAQHKLGFTYLAAPQSPDTDGVIPTPLTFERMLGWTETYDGTQGLGIARGPYDNALANRFNLAGKNRAAFRLTPR